MSLHGKIAEAVYQDVGRAWVQCVTCGRRIEVTMENAAHYLAGGWPKCCGYTMRFHTQKDQRPTTTTGEGA